ncbi:MAG: YdcF family protein, partial [Parcubacteria group bacterium]|nr:YdcF family protein [Parcubacteria group bacterium]
MEMIIEAKAKEETFRPDAIIVIGAGLLKDGTNIIPSIQTKNNIEKAVQLIIDYNKLNHDAMPIPLVFSGGYTINGKEEAIVMQEYFFKNFGMFTERNIWLEFQSKNSYENIAFCLNLIRKENWKQVIIIDQPMHLLQLRLLSNKELRIRELKTSLYFIGAEPAWG